MSIIYEVSLQVPVELEDRYVQWLQAHIAEILELPGFEAAELMQFAIPQKLMGFRVQYWLESQAALSNYLEQQAPRLRASGLRHFGATVTAERAILHSLQSFCAPITKPSGRLYSKRLLVRPLELGDAEFILMLMSQASWMRYIGDRGVSDLESARRYLQNSPIAMQEREGHSLQWVGLDAQTPIGLCGLLKRPELEAPDLGFALLSEFEGHGYAFEASQLIVEDARHRLGLARILAICQSDNSRSQRLLGSLGFTLQKSKCAQIEQHSELPRSALLEPERPTLQTWELSIA